MWSTLILCSLLVLKNIGLPITNSDKILKLTPVLIENPTFDFKDVKDGLHTLTEEIKNLYTEFRKMPKDVTLAKEIEELETELAKIKKDESFIKQSEKPVLIENPTELKDIQEAISSITKQIKDLALKLHKMPKGKAQDNVNKEIKTLNTELGKIEQDERFIKLSEKPVLIENSTYVFEDVKEGLHTLTEEIKNLYTEFRKMQKDVTLAKEVDELETELAKIKKDESFIKQSEKPVLIENPAWDFNDLKKNLMTLKKPFLV